MTRARRLMAIVLVVIVALTTVVAGLGAWLRRGLGDTDAFVEVMAPLSQNEQVATELGDRAAEELFDVVPVEDFLSDRLPGPTAILAIPIAGGLENAAARAATSFILSEQFNNVWERILRAAHTALVTVLRADEDDVVSVSEGTLTLNLLPVVTAAFVRVGTTLEDLGLDLPADLETMDEESFVMLLEERFGVDLPDDFGQVTVLESEALEQMEDFGRRLDRLISLAIAITILGPIAAVAISPVRRRSVVEALVAISVGVVVTGLTLDVVETALTKAADSSGVLREVVQPLVEFLHRLDWLIIATLVVIVLVGLFLFAMGSSRLATRGREAVGISVPSWLRDEVVDEAPATPRGWAVAHRGALQLAGIVAVLGVLALVDALTWQLLVAGLALMSLWLLVLALIPAGSGVPASVD